MSDAPERLWLHTTHNAEAEKPCRYWEYNEYVRADRIEALEAQIAEDDARAIRLAEVVRDAAARACERAAYDGEFPINDHINLGCLRSQAAIRAIDPRALLEQMKEEE